MRVIVLIERDVDILQGRRIDDDECVIGHRVVFGKGEVMITSYVTRSQG